jgi:membrane fusion protein, adhesin transport system
MKVKWSLTNWMSKPQDKQILHLPAFEIFDEKHHFRWLILAIITTTMAILLLIGWASYTKIDETTKTFGEVVPKDKISIAQHLEGGIIRNIFVKEGEQVQQDDVLIELDATASVAELQQMQARAVVLNLDAHRLHDYLSLKPSQQAIKPENKTAANATDIVEQEFHLLNAQKQLRHDQKEVIHAQIQQDKEQLHSLKKQFDFLTTKLSLLEKERYIDQALLKEEELSAKEYLHLLRDVNQTQAERNKIKGEYKRIKQSYYEKTNHLKQLDAELRESAYQQLVKTNAELLEVNNIVKKLMDTVKRTQIRAPVAGIVNGLDTHIGNVVSSGSTLVEIVPQDTPLIVETQIDPRDIGHIHLGDTAKVKVLTYDFARYGTIPGKLVQLSASTFTDKKNNHKFYRGIVELDKQYVGNNPNQYRLMPGMSVEAEIVTGDKTVLQYLLKPVHVVMNNAFAEN